MVFFFAMGTLKVNIDDILDINGAVIAFILYFLPALLHQVPLLPKVKQPMPVEEVEEEENDGKEGYVKQGGTDIVIPSNVML